MGRHGCACAGLSRITSPSLDTRLQPSPDLRLLVALAADKERAWLDVPALSSSGVSARFLPLGETASGTLLPPGAPEAGVSSRRAPKLPDLRALLETLEKEMPDACLTLSGGFASRVVRLASDALGIPVFSLLTSPEELVNSGRREKGRPDLFFLADARLLPLALDDPRYGSTMLPTGHPGRDLVLDGSPLADPLFAEPAYGDGQAGRRILAAMRRWWRGELEPIRPELTVIVPAFREETNLPLVCERLLETFERDPVAAEILLVDDASPDKTYAVAVEQMWRSPRIRALTKPPPRGMGNAIRHGLQRARAPIVAITMGDGSDEVSRIPEMFRRVRDDGYSLAIGCRYRRPENYAAVPHLYRFWSRCFRIVTRLLIGVRLQDYTNSFRVYHRKIFERYGPESGGFEISPESTFKAWFATRRVTEVDVRHLKRTAGQSKFSFLKAGPGYAKILIKAFVNRLTGRWFVLDW